MGWQQDHRYETLHEELLDELNALAGKQVRNLEEDIAHLSSIDQVKARVLNVRNTEAVRKYYGERLKELK